MTRIIINFPTNIGDAILALPVVDRIKSNFPQSNITAIVSPKTKDFLRRNNFIDEAVLFDKSWSISQKRRFAVLLRKKFDVIVDLKNSLLPFILGVKVRTPYIRVNLKSVNVRDRYLSLIKKIAKNPAQAKSEFVLFDEEKNKWDSYRLGSALFIACSSRSHLKQYPYQYLKKVIVELKKEYPIVVLGENRDRQFYQDILDLDGVVDLVGKTKMIDVFYLLKNYGFLLLAVDSSILHIASYLNMPVVSLFGPTDAAKFASASDNSLVLRNQDVPCAPCQKAECRFNEECMKIPTQIVIEKVKGILSSIKK